MQTLKALFINTSLKSSKDPSHTEGFINDVQVHYNQLGVESEIVRLADYDVAYGVQEDMGEGDEWPKVFEKVMAADIVIIGTPLWLGEKSSLATQTIERLYGSSSVTNDKGQSVFYNKVGGVAITGNEDGAKHAAASVLYALSHIGFVIPPNVDAYWVGEAGPGASYMDAGRENEFTKAAIQRLAYNTYHLAGMLKNNPIPNEGNTL
ncbi:MULTISPECIES: NAD(P)H-dependent oxidoreductase [Planococcus]|uniref:BRAMP protein n=2 Tax=Planococcus TaxID=1372 RepID=A0ABM5WT97_9BACL|nr:MULTISPECIES: NAD(P)H-dependent oxidoreductase [Planococcus]ALS77583.1 BRAMP protein [Planococcus kocurii]AQU80533.1 BRAMP protein [Planococcus faecalis]KAA0959032.1 flavodoxin family protein [Planococcus sp. ANT_H30]MDJ0330175.1 NAD(P)H-dependent oxidoreductase [Planococcus sp. S3-L1]